MADGQTKGNAPTLFGGEYVRSKPLHELFAKADGDRAESQALEFEDEFRGQYASLLEGGASLIAPPYLPRQLEALVAHSNALGACIDAVVTNVHETGFVIEYKEKDKNEDIDNDPEVKAVRDFFDEVWPQVSFAKLRKAIGQDVEKTGMGYIEVVRNMKGEMLMLRRLETKLMRLVTLSKPFDVEVSIRRGDTVVKATVPMRYRRFAQMVAGKIVYFKEYGCPLVIDKITGELFDKKDKVRLIREKRLGSEVIVFGKNPDVETPYSVPAWVPQMPSVLGSRKAEEFNLDYFESGGVPPLMVFVHGGQLAPTAKAALSEFLASKPGAKQGAPVFEAISTGGDLNGGGSSNQVRVTVERFGSERQKDSMFEGYDERCEQRIRRAWRLPPIFVGLAEDYSFATAHASYSVGEAQVFKPDRDEFDDVVNTTIMRELDPEGHLVYRSLGIPVKDVTNQLAALMMAKDSLKPSDFIKHLNEAVALKMRAHDNADTNFEEKQSLALETQRNMANPAFQAGNSPTQPGKPGEKPSTPAKAKDAPVKSPTHSKKDDRDLPSLLAAQVYDVINLGGGSKEVFDLMTEVAKMQPDAIDLFKNSLTELVYAETANDDPDVGRFTAAALMMAIVR